MMFSLAADPGGLPGFAAVRGLCRTAGRVVLDHLASDLHELVAFPGRHGTNGSPGYRAISSRAGDQRGAAGHGHRPARRKLPHPAIRVVRLTLFGACGVTNKSLRALTARLLGTSYSSSQMTRHLRLNGLIRRIEHTHTYALTPDGRRIAIFYTKIYNRLLRPLAAADQP
jgi:hypothetical protein